MFLKKKEKNPEWTEKQDWEWTLAGAQPRPSIEKFTMYDSIPIQDITRHAQIIPHQYTDMDIKTKMNNERRKIKLQQSNKKNVRGLLKGLGDKLFGRN